VKSSAIRHRLSHPQLWHCWHWRPIGKGEAEAIAIAHERNALLILDDGLARRHAKVVGVTLTGTLGVVVKAKTAGLIPTVAPLVSRLTELGFRLSVQTRDSILKLANEA
jgi:predicted nucleic acid-binding protein